MHRFEAQEMAEEEMIERLAAFRDSIPEGFVAAEPGDKGSFNNVLYGWIKPVEKKS